MKKLLLVLLAIVVLAGGYLFYQHGRVSNQLESFLKGKTFTSRYGLKIEIPPTEGKVEGFLQPQVKLPRVVLDLSAWGLEQPLNIEDVVASRKLWGQENIRLGVPRELSSQDWGKIVKPYAELRVTGADSGASESTGAGNQDGTILSLGSDSIEFTKKLGIEGDNPPESFKMIAPYWLLGEGTFLMPKHSELSWQGIRYQDGKEKGEFGPLKIAFTSEKHGDRQAFKFQMKQESGSIKTSKSRNKVGGGEFLVMGDTRALTESQWKETEQALRANFENIKSIYDALERGGEGGMMALSSPKIAQVFESSSKSFYEVTQELDVQIKEANFNWQGLSSENTQGVVQVSVSPLQFKQTGKYSENSFEWVYQGGLDKLEFDVDKTRISLHGLKLNLDSKYLGTTFAHYIAGYLDFYVSSSALKVFEMMGAKDPTPHALNNFLAYLLGYIAYYPNDSDFSLTLDQLNYEGPSVTGKHRAMALNYHLKPEAIGYEIQGDFDIRYKERENGEAKKARLPFESGKARLAMKLSLPWSELVNLAREVSQKPEAHPNIMEELGQLFKDKNNQFDLDLFLDFGKEYFSFNWDSEMTAPAGETISQVPFPQVPWRDIDEEALENQYINALRKAWVQEGSLKIDVDIQRYTQFQKFLDEIQPGASLGLAVVAPYVKIDSQGDTLKSKIELKDQQVLVNGNPNESLNQILAPYR